MPIYMGPKRSSKKVGAAWVPQDVRRRRRDVENLMKRMGTPVLHKPRYNDLDFRNGLVDKSPVYDDIYEQTRNRDPLSHGVGYVSKELSPNEWYDANGNIITGEILYPSPTQSPSGSLSPAVGPPGAGWTQAPRYRGYGPGTMTYVIEPDRSEDFFKATTGGPLFKVQTALAIAPWWPDIDDNDILINVELDGQGNIIKTNERYECKNVNPVSMHGLNKRGRRESGSDYTTTGQFPNTFLMNQSFEMALVPFNDVIYDVETDR